MDRQTLRDWVYRYNAEGVEGLKDRQHPGRKPLLGEKQLAELAGQVSDAKLLEQTKKLLPELERAALLHARVQKIIADVKAIGGTTKTEPGGPAWLAAAPGSADFDQSARRHLDFLVQVHELQQIVLITHFGCAHYAQRLQKSAKECLPAQC